MKFFVKIVQKCSGLIVFFLLTVSIIGCRDDHIFRYGTTAPSPFGNSFLVVGDSRSGDSVYRKIVDSITSSLSDADCLIHLSDMIEDPGTQAKWGNFLDMTASVSRVTPWYGVVGNHDVGSISLQTLYQSVMDAPSDQLYYSVDLYL